MAQIVHILYGSYAESPDDSEHSPYGVFSSRRAAARGAEFWGLDDWWTDEYALNGLPER